MIGFEDFADDVIQKNTSRGVPMRPVNEMGVIKHDARKGALSILLPGGTDDEKLEAKMKSVDFVVITQIQYLKGPRLISSPSFQEVFDLYEKKEKGNRSIGLMAWADIKKSTDDYFEHGKTRNKIRTRERLVGLLRKVDGKAPKENAEINAVFGDNPVPVFFDVYSKKREVLEAAWPGNTYNGVIISMQEDTSSKTKYKVSFTEDGEKKTATNYRPLLTVKKFEKANLAKMAKYAQGYLIQSSKWLAQIKENDRFLNDLYEAGFRGPNTVNTLQAYGVNRDTWVDKLREWQQKGLDPRFEVSHMLADDEPTSQLGMEAPRQSTPPAEKPTEQLTNDNTAPAPKQAPAGGTDEQTAEKATAQPTEKPAEQPADASTAPAPKPAPVGDTEITDEDLPF